MGNHITIYKCIKITLHTHEFTQCYLSELAKKKNTKYAVSARIGDAVVTYKSWKLNGFIQQGLFHTQKIATVGQVTLETPFVHVIAEGFRWFPACFPSQKWHPWSLPRTQWVPHPHTSWLELSLAVHPTTKSRRKYITVCPALLIP